MIFEVSLAAPTLHKEERSGDFRVQAFELRECNWLHHEMSNYYVLSATNLVLACARACSCDCGAMQILFTFHNNHMTTFLQSDWTATIVAAVQVQT